MGALRAGVFAGYRPSLDWYQNDRGEWCPAVEDDASRFVLAMIETESRSSATSVEVLDEARQVYEAESDIPILEVITGHGSAFINTHHEDRPCSDHAFEGYLDEMTIRSQPRWVFMRDQRYLHQTGQDE